MNGVVKVSVLPSFSLLNDQLPFVETFFKVYPLATEQLLACKDKAYFLAISQRPSFLYWMQTLRSGLKRYALPLWLAFFSLILVWQDSLWAVEDIKAVFDQDLQCVCILQGPVAVKHSKVKDEPI